VIARRLAYVMLAMVIAASGAYLFIYLYRWEWNRAVIAGIFLIAAGMALAAGMLFERMNRIEEKIEALGRAQHEETLAAIRDTAPEPKERFKWLSGSGDQMSVFVPVLMGAGVVFSGIAWLVERLARATARPAMEEGLAFKLAPIALPQGGFLAPVGDMPVGPRRGHLKKYRTAFILLLVGAAVSVSVDKLGDLTQNRPDPDIFGKSGAVTMEITRHGWTRSEVSAAKSLWAACKGTVRHDMMATGFIPNADGTLTMLLSPAPGESAQRRLTGCLEDAVLDNVQAGVVSFRTTNL
jgi:HAMP domain-containing protein